MTLWRPREHPLPSHADRLASGAGARRDDGVIPENQEGPNDPTAAVGGSAAVPDPPLSDEHHGRLVRPRRKDRAISVIRSAIANPLSNCGPSAGFRPRATAGDRGAKHQTSVGRLARTPTGRRGLRRSIALRLGEPGEDGRGRTPDPLPVQGRPQPSIEPPAKIAIGETPRSPDTPQTEPQLHDLLMSLSRRQRTSVVLVLGWQWSYGEVAELLGISKSSVQRHVERALLKLRSGLGVDIDE